MKNRTVLLIPILAAVFLSGPVRKVSADYAATCQNVNVPVYEDCRGYFGPYLFSSSNSTEPFLTPCPAGMGGLAGYLSAQPFTNSVAIASYTSNANQPTFCSLYKYPVTGGALFGYASSTKTGNFTVPMINLGALVGADKTGGNLTGGLGLYWMSSTSTSSNCTCPSGGILSGTTCVTTPPSCTASWNVASVTLPGNATFLWSSTNATNASYVCTGPIPGAVNVSVSGSVPYTFNSAGTENCTVTVSGPNGTGSCSAALPVVNPVSYTLNLSSGGTGTGKITYNGTDCLGSCAPSFTSGTAVTVSGSASTGSTFSGWNGSGCSGTGNCTLNMDSNKTLSGTFNADCTPCAPTDTVPCGQSYSDSCGYSCGTGTKNCAETGTWKEVAP